MQRNVFQLHILGELLWKDCKFDCMSFVPVADTKTHLHTHTRRSTTARTASFTLLAHSEHVRHLALPPHGEFWTPPHCNFQTCNHCEIWEWTVKYFHKRCQAHSKCWGCTTGSGAKERQPGSLSGNTPAAPGAGWLLVSQWYAQIFFPSGVLSFDYGMAHLRVILASIQGNQWSGEGKVKVHLKNELK